MIQYRIIISGGGTGGHVFPALAIAKAIEKKKSNVEILFVGALGRMEMRRVPEAGYNIKGLWINGIDRRLSLRNFVFPIKLVHSLLKSRQIIKDFNPNLAIGTGGYASGPLIYMAARNNIPTLIQEQNSYPGITNKVLSKFVNKICVAYDNAGDFFAKTKLVFTGNPIRQEVLDCNNKRDDAIEYFNLTSNKNTVLIIGGSLGAKTINQVIQDNIHFFVESDLNLIWQTGINGHKQVKDINLEGVSIYKFIKKMDLAFAAADFIVSRAGAIAISELCFVGKPTILIPSPNVSEDHQTKNAQALVNKNAIISVKDEEADCKLVDCLDRLIKNRELQEELSRNIKRLAVVDAADRIANEAIDMLK